MTHRKSQHSEVVKVCTMFLQNICRFKNEICWFKHDNVKNGNTKIIDNQQNTESPPVFQNITKIADPPQKESRQEEEKGKE